MDHLFGENLDVPLLLFRKKGDAIPGWGTNPASSTTQRMELWQGTGQCVPRGTSSAEKGKFAAPKFFLVSLGRKVFTTADVRNALLWLSESMFDGGTSSQLEVGYGRSFGGRSLTIQY